MRLALLLSSIAATAAVALFSLGCSSGSSADDGVVTPGEDETSEDELRSLTLTETDNGKTVTVTEGQNVAVRLKSNPSTGFKWVVASTDRTFGYPAFTRFYKNGDAIGAGGVERMTWKTKGALPMVGEHHVKLEYKRAWETDVAPAQTFEFTVKIRADIKQCPELVPPGPGFCKAGEPKPKFDPSTGCITGFDCISDCRANGCGATQKCSLCWGNFACIPQGAIC